MERPFTNNHRPNKCLTNSIVSAKPKPETICRSDNKMSNVHLQQHFLDKMAYRYKELKYMSSEIQHPKPGNSFNVCTNYRERLVM